MTNSGGRVYWAPYKKYGLPESVVNVYVCMYVCMHDSICDAPLLQQSRARARRPNRKDVSLACHSKVSMSMLDHEVTVAEFHNFGAQAVQLRGPKQVF